MALAEGAGVIDELVLFDVANRGQAGGAGDGFFSCV